MRWLLGAWLVLVSCGERPPECLTTAQCGSAQACLNSTCEDVQCRSNTDCGLESVCDPIAFTCVPGCDSSEDCLVGDRCDVTTMTCVPRACRDTQLDCDLGERCDASTGTCQPDPEPHCRPCGSDLACGPTGVCQRFTTDLNAYCFLSCSPEAVDPCPAGLQCSGTSDGGFRCVGQCGAL